MLNKSIRVIVLSIVAAAAMSVATYAQNVQDPQFKPFNFNKMCMKLVPEATALKTKCDNLCSMSKNKDGCITSCSQIFPASISTQLDNHCNTFF